MKGKILNMCENICRKKLEADEQLIITGLFDSSGIIELIANLEDEYQIVFFPEDILNLDNFSCVNNIVNIVKIKLEESWKAGNM